MGAYTKNNLDNAYELQSADQPLNGRELQKICSGEAMQTGYRFPPQLQ